MKKDSSGGSATKTLYVRGLSDFPLVQRTGGGVEKVYVYGATGLAAIRINGTWHYTVGDHLGSTRVIYNAQGSAEARYEYDPYGNIYYAAVNPDVKYLFTGQELELDAATGLFNFRARMYDDSLGLFYAPDPAGDNFSPYGYVRGNPLSAVDRDGRRPEMHEENVVAQDNSWNGGGGGDITLGDAPTDGGEGMTDASGSSFDTEGWYGWGGFINYQANEKQREDAQFALWQARAGLFNSAIAPPALGLPNITDAYLDAAISKSSFDYVIFTANLFFGVTSFEGRSIGSTSAQVLALGTLTWFTNNAGGQMTSVTTDALSGPWGQGAIPEGDYRITGYGNWECDGMKMPDGTYWRACVDGVSGYKDVRIHFDQTGPAPEAYPGTSGCAGIRSADDAYAWRDRFASYFGAPAPGGPPNQTIFVGRPIPFMVRYQGVYTWGGS